jgi:hypothetical protein
MGRAANDIIAAAQAGQMDRTHYLIGALVGMTEANAHGIEVWWDNYAPALIPDGPPLIPGVDVHLGERWGQADIDRAVAEGRLVEHMAEHGFYPEGEEP